MSPSFGGLSSSLAVDDDSLRATMSLTFCNMLEIVPDIAQSTHGIRNIFADIRNVPTRPHMVLGMFLLAFPVTVEILLNVRAIGTPPLKIYTGNSKAGLNYITRRQDNIHRARSNFGRFQWQIH